MIRLLLLLMVLRSAAAWGGDISSPSAPPDQTNPGGQGGTGPGGGAASAEIAVRIRRATEYVERGNKPAACDEALSILNAHPDEPTAVGIVRLTCADTKLPGQLKIRKKLKGAPSPEPPPGPPPPEPAPAPQPAPQPAADHPGSSPDKPYTVPLKGVVALQDQPAVVVDGQVQASIRATGDAEGQLKVGNYRETIRLATEAIEANPGNPRAFLIRGYAHKGRKNWRAVLEDAEGGLALRPNDSMLLKLKADAQNRGKDCKGALETAEKIITINATDATALALKAWALGCLGDREGMFATLKTAAALDPAYEGSLKTADEFKNDPERLFLFPGEERPAEKKRPSGLGNRGRLIVAAVFGLITFVGLVAGLGQLARSRAAAQFDAGVQPAPAADGRALPPLAASRPPVVASRYELRDKIGEGAMGPVFAGFDTGMQRVVALRKMRPEFAADPARLKSLSDQAGALAALSHPCIAAVREVALHEGEVFVVCEFAAGRPLAGLLREAKRLPFDRCRGLIEQACQALDCAHSRGVMHRDLKPSNIMVDEQDRVKLTDFVLARLAKDALSKAAGTDAAGALAYMAPEQHRGGAVPASDVYALGVCLYEMLAGILPFRGPDFLAQKEAAAFVAPDALASSVPKAVEPLLVEVFRPDPRQRLADPLELLRRLNEI